MDLNLSEEQRLLQNAARDFLEKECPESLVRDMEDDALGYSPDLWRKMAEQGWTGLIVPGPLGGVGMGFSDLMILVEECGRFLVPGPFVPSTVGTIALMEAGNDAQKREYLPGVASGDRKIILAFTEPSARFDAEGVELTAKKDGTDYVLNGIKLFIRDSHVADNLVVVARTSGAGEDGISLFIVDAKAAGIAHNPIWTVASDKQNEVRFDNVRVPASALLGEEGKAWPAFKRIANKATILECAYLVGLAQMDFDISVNYAQERVQFGRPIGSFQAIQHKATDMITDVDGSRLITYNAAMAIDENAPDAEELVHMAKAWCSEATRRVVAHGQQIHGGIGFTKEYKIQLYFRRQKASELAWGDADFHRELVARSAGL